MAIQIPPSLYAPSLNTAVKSAKAQTGQSVVLDNLAKAMPGVIKLTEKQSPEDTANNILKHVQKGVDQLRSQGASEERIKERLQAARDGIEKGYAQATDMLKSLGLMDDDLQGQINAGRKLVDTGLESLASRPQNTEQTLPVKSSSLAVANSLSLQVLTREGDRVTVSFAQAKGGAFAQTDESFAASGFSQQSWSMSVEGHLNDDEKKALGSLFNDVQDLSERFFAGDIGKALDQAMSLGFDGKQLASLSLNLLQQSQFTSVSPYKQVQELPTPELESLKAPLASYVDSYIKALDKAQPLAEPANAFQDLVQKLLPTETRMPAWKAFHDGLNDLAALFPLSAVSKPSTPA